MELTKEETLLIVKLVSIALANSKSIENISGYGYMIWELQEKLELFLTEEQESEDEDESEVEEEEGIGYSLIQDESSSPLDVANPTAWANLPAILVQDGAGIDFKIHFMTQNGEVNLVSGENSILLFDVISAIFDDEHDVLTVYAVDYEDEESYHEISFNVVSSDDLAQIKLFFGNSEVWTSLENKEKYE